MRYQLMPFARLENGEFSLPDFVLLEVWRQLNAEGRAETVFYEGGVKTEQEWLAYVKRPTNHFVFVVDAEEKKIVFAAWLNNILGHVAFSHFFGLGPYKPEMGRAVIMYWQSMGLPMLLIGIIPEHNDRAIRLAMNLGYKPVGNIPRYCNFADKGEFRTATVLYFDTMKITERSV